MEEFELVLENELELVIEWDDGELVIEEDGVTELVMEEDTELLLDSDTIEILEVYGGTPGEPGTKVTYSETPPPNPRVGDLWIVKA